MRNTKRQTHRTDQRNPDGGEFLNAAVESRTSRKVWTASMRPESRVSFPTATTSHRTGPCARTSPASMVSPTARPRARIHPSAVLCSGHRSLDDAPVGEDEFPASNQFCRPVSPSRWERCPSSVRFARLRSVPTGRQTRVSPAGAMENDDMLSTVSSCSCSFRALGKRSKPPCIASRALISASPSKWMVNATRMRSALLPCPGCTHR